MTFSAYAEAPQHFGSTAVRLYSRIREDLRASITSGAWQPNDRLPSESELITRYSVSRITVRQALSDLQRDGLIFKVAGKGSFVAPAKPFQELTRLQGFAEAMGALGHATFNRVLSVRATPAPTDVAQRLLLPADEPVIEIRRVRHVGPLPVSLDLTWLPLAIGQRVAREDLAGRDIFNILETDCGLPLGHADLVVDAVLADAEQAALLGVHRGAPLLHIERLTHGADGRPLDHEHLFCRPDNFQYRLRVHRGPTPT